MGKVNLNKERCIGCGACMSIAPENFTFGDDGRAEMINSESTTEAIEASEMCPVSAITVEGNCDCNECNCTKEDNCGCMNECNCNDDCNCTDDCNCGCKEDKNLEN